MDFPRTKRGYHLNGLVGRETLEMTHRATSHQKYNLPTIHHDNHGEEARLSRKVGACSGNALPFTLAGNGFGYYYYRL